jgi:hypothetical protein
MFLRQKKIRIARKIGRMECMSCPHYIDYTRTCIQYFPRVLEFPDFTVCDSEEYPNCLAYICLKTGFLCKYSSQCLEDITTKMPILVRYLIEDEKAVKLLKNLAERYCTSVETHRQCASFKLFEQGIHPPVDLMPDGSKLRLRDLLLKKEIMIK